ISRHWSTRVGFVTRTTAPKLTTTKQQVRKEEKKWGVGSLMVAAEGDRMKEVVVVDVEME
ncbi:hypothetical protein A2U01_0094586, partial [Trifolium medium]|nr:hypothetical protein [Trifolium medium]